LQVSNLNSIQSYVKDRAVFWNCARQLAGHNRLVEELSEGYYEIEQVLNQQGTDIDAWLHAPEQLHPVIDTHFLSVGKGIAVRDCIHLLKTGEPQLPSGLMEALVFIEQNQLIKRVKSEVGKMEDPVRLARQQAEQKRKEHFEADLENLESQLKQAKIEVASSPTTKKPFLDAKVKGLEETVKKLRDSKSPLSGISWT